MRERCTGRCPRTLSGQSADWPGKAKSKRTVTVTDYTRRQMVSLQHPDISMFTGAQIGILNQMIDVIVPLTASQLSRVNRDDPLWNELENNAAMSVATGSIVMSPVAPQ